MVCLISAVLVIVAGISKTALSQINNPGENFDFNCGPNRAITRISSIYDGNFSDRQWWVTCSPILGVWNQCYNTRIFPTEALRTGTSCGDGLLNGFFSNYDPITRDRGWSIRCCRNSGFLVTNCRSTRRTLLQQPFDIQTRPGAFINAIYGFFSPPTRDRQWSFTVCDVLIVPGGPRGPRRRRLRKNQLFGYWDSI